MHRTDKSPKIILTTAYCDALTKLEMDHAIPINKTKLGEHRLGNVIPSCRKCNKEKHHRDFLEFLGDNKRRSRRMKSYMETRNYTPLRDNQQIKLIIEQAHSGRRRRRRRGDPAPDYRRRRAAQERPRSPPALFLITDYRVRLGPTKTIGREGPAQDVIRSTSSSVISSPVRS
jgi:HNH endonuclease